MLRLLEAYVCFDNCVYSFTLRLSCTHSTFDCFKPASMLYETYVDKSKSDSAPQTAYELCFGAPMFADLHTVSVVDLLSFPGIGLCKLTLSQPEHKETALVRPDVRCTSSQPSLRQLAAVQ